MHLPGDRGRGTGATANASSRSCASCSTMPCATPPTGTHVSVRADRHNGSAELTVADSGPGMALRGAGEGVRALLHRRRDARRRPRPGDRARAGRADGRPAAGGRPRPGDTEFTLELPRDANGRRRREARDAGASLALRGGAARPAAATTTQAQGPTKVTTTQVQVVEGVGRDGGFHPAAIYRRLSPGVVTVLSIFDGGGSLLEDGGEGGQGSGFVLDGSGFVATNAHVVLEGESGDRQARRPGVRRVLRRQPRARPTIVGRRPERGRRAAEGRPARADADAAAARPLVATSTSASRSPRSAARSASASRCRSA